MIALEKAIRSRTTTHGLIHHSDRGLQYCCDPDVCLLQEHGIHISMTKSGSPYDNAIAERVNGILKTELNLDKSFTTYSAAVAVVHQAIDAYNRLRPHMSISNLTPNQAQDATQNLSKKWKSKPYCKAKSVVL